MKKEIKENYRVVVKPVKVVGPEFTPTEELEACSYMAARLGDEYWYDFKVSIEHDTKEVCSFCGEDWWEDNPNEGEIFPCCDVAEALSGSKKKPRINRAKRGC